MLNDPASNTAELFKLLDRRVSRLEHRDRTGASVRVSRSISDTAQTSDNLTHTTSPAGAGFIIGTDSVGRGFL